MESNASDHERFMARALELAERGRYSVSPNPMVGCVITVDGAILGEGHHERTGEGHAEILAIRAAGKGVAGATVYVSLEPCAHHGRTPPCADALIEARVARVVVATIDPSPDIAGRGLEKLQSAGIEVVTGVMQEQAERLNEKFLWSTRHRRPFVLLKAGISLDGKLATIAGSSQWITSTQSRERSLALREEYDAIMVGGRTVALDNPKLTRRLGWNQAIAPLTRIVIDGDVAIPHDASILTDGGDTLVYSSDPDRYRDVDAQIVGCTEAEGRLDLGEVLDDLGKRGVRSVIVEGGGRLITALVRMKLWQKMTMFVAPMLIGGSTAPALFMDDSIRELTHAVRFRFDEVERLGDDFVVTAYPFDQPE